MSKRTPIDKEQVRARRNRLLETAAAAELSLTEAVREMRAIAGMTQEEFARHRGVSARIIKAIELGQANPTVATLNQIGQFFGLEVGFVPVRRVPSAAEQPRPTTMSPYPSPADAVDAPSVRFTMPSPEKIREIAQKVLMDALIQGVEEGLRATMSEFPPASQAREKGSGPGKKQYAKKGAKTATSLVQNTPTQVEAKEVTADVVLSRKARKTPAS